MTKQTKTTRLLRSMNKSRPEIKTPIADDMFLPNHSGDHAAGEVQATPTQPKQLVNKEYVDDNIGSDHPHQDVQTTASPTFDGLTSTGQINLALDGHNIITASRMAGELRLGAGGETADLIIDTGGNVNIGENLTVGGTIINTDFTTLTDNSMADTLHRHSELNFHQYLHSHQYQ